MRILHIWVDRDANKADTSAFCGTPHAKFGSDLSTIAADIKFHSLNERPTYRICRKCFKKLEKSFWTLAFYDAMRD